MRVVRSREVYRGRVITVREDILESEHGPLRRDVVLHPGAVVLVAVCDGALLLVRQHRYAVGRSLLELPAGTLEAGETPLVCAQRELREETGYSAREILPLGGAFAAPGYSSELLHFFYCEQLEPNPRPGDADELIELVRWPLSRLKDIKSHVEDAKTGMGLWLLGMRLGQD